MEKRVAKSKKKREIKVQIEKGNKSPNRKGEYKSKQKREIDIKMNIKVQIEKGNKSPNKNWRK